MQQIVAPSNGCTPHRHPEPRSAALWRDQARPVARRLRLRLPTRRIHQLALHSLNQGNEVDHVRDAELLHRLRTLGVDGLRTHPEHTSDVAIAETRHGEFDDLALSRCKAREARLRLVDLHAG